jgi:hypothetical protein
MRFCLEVIALFFVRFAVFSLVAVISNEGAHLKYEIEKKNRRRKANIKKAL